MKTFLLLLLVSFNVFAEETRITHLEKNKHYMVKGTIRESNQTSAVLEIFPESSSTITVKIAKVKMKKPLPVDTIVELEIKSTRDCSWECDADFIDFHNFVLPSENINSFKKAIQLLDL